MITRTYVFLGILSHPHFGLDSRPFKGELDPSLEVESDNGLQGDNWQQNITYCQGLYMISINEGFPLTDIPFQSGEILHHFHLFPIAPLQPVKHHLTHFSVDPGDVPCALLGTVDLSCLRSCFVDAGTG